MSLDRKRNLWRAAVRPLNLGNLPLAFQPEQRPESLLIEAKRFTILDDPHAHVFA